MATMDVDSAVGTSTVDVVASLPSTRKTATAMEVLVVIVIANVNGVVRILRAHGLLIGIFSMRMLMEKHRFQIWPWAR